MRGDDELLRTWGAARPEIQSAHAHQGRSCSAPVPKLPPGSLPPPSSGTEARFSGGGGNLQAESDPSSRNFQMGFRQGKGDPCEIERPGGASTNAGRRIAPVSAVLGAASWIGGRRGDHGCGLGISACIKRRRVHPTPPCCWSWGTR
ncbi:uncharacterized protein [Triticum aestivum]|uniref:uncharacterized protein n=1 Tax=Triticum aestivum TaxID=4565 RepID=UPI001D03489D|nr:uncharacterized protein LOC123097852 [Triticum aestivum]